MTHESRWKAKIHMNSFNIKLYNGKQPVQNAKQGKVLMHKMKSHGKEV